MNDITLKQLAEQISIKEKAEEFCKVKKAINDMKLCVENLECVYDTADENDIEKRLLDLSYKHAAVMEFLLSFTHRQDTESKEDCYAEIEENMFSVAGSKEEGIVITTPFPPIKCGNARTHISKMFAQEIERLLDKKYAQKGYQLPVYDKASVHFIVSLGIDIDANHIPDADNLDLKNILDAMQQYLFPNDNLVTIDYKVTGEYVSAKSKMRIVVKSKL